MTSLTCKAALSPAEWEKVSLDLAGAAGIRVPDSELLRIGGRGVLIVNRFDREGERRVGYVSATTMLESTDGDIGSYIDIAAVIEEVSLAGDRRPSRALAADRVQCSDLEHRRPPAKPWLPARARRQLDAFAGVRPEPEPCAGPKQVSNMIDGYDTAASIDTLVTVAGFFRLTEGDNASALADVLAAG